VHLGTPLSLAPLALGGRMLEDAVAGVAEARPQLVLDLLVDRADRLPLALQLLDSRRGGAGVGGGAEGLGLLAEGLLAPAVVLALALLLLEVLGAPGVEAVLRRAEALPEPLVVVTAGRSGRLSSIE
jgi:hypothetical protein